MLDRIKTMLGELGAQAAGVASGVRERLEPHLYETLSTKIRPTELAALMTRALGIKRRRFESGYGVFDIDPVSNFGFRLFKDGVYEPETIELLERCLGAGDTFVDLGANEGYFSVLASRLVGHGQVFAIEPQRRCWPVIVQNLADNDCANVTLVPYGVAREACTFELVLTPPTNTGASSFVASRRGSLWPRQTVHALPLDEILARYSVGEVALMKVDIEGYELEALESAGEALASGRIHNLIVEVHPRQLAELGRDPGDVQRILEGHGYQRRGEVLYSR
ncbi:MAG TPA: FkbM family methyltransferase [Myxococcota bacterium]|nr:FkbM family methyltransferase [Myxococcota bacterium]